jgi:hypothetical protein
MKPGVRPCERYARGDRRGLAAGHARPFRALDSGTSCPASEASRQGAPVHRMRWGCPSDGSRSSHLDSRSAANDDHRHSGHEGGEPNSKCDAATGEHLPSARDVGVIIDSGNEPGPCHEAEARQRGHDAEARQDEPRHSNALRSRPHVENTVSGIRKPKLRRRHDSVSAHEVVSASPTGMESNETRPRQSRCSRKLAMADPRRGVATSRSCPSPRERTLPRWRSGSATLAPAEAPSPATDLEQSRRVTGHTGRRADRRGEVSRRRIAST